MGVPRLQEMLCLQHGERRKQNNNLRDVRYSRPHPLLKPSSSKSAFQIVVLQRLCLLHELWVKAESVEQLFRRILEHLEFKSSWPPKATLRWLQQILQEWQLLLHLYESLRREHLRQLCRLRWVPEMDPRFLRRNQRWRTRTVWEKWYQILLSALQIQKTKESLMKSVKT